MPHQGIGLKKPDPSEPTPWHNGAPSVDCDYVVLEVAGEQVIYKNTYQCNTVAHIPWHWKHFQKSRHRDTSLSEPKNPACIHVPVPSFWGLNALPLRSCLSLFQFTTLIYSPPEMWTRHMMASSKYFPSCWPFVRENHRSPVNSPHKGQWRGALIFSLICT